MKDKIIAKKEKSLVMMVNEKLKTVKKPGRIDIAQLNIPPEKHEFETAKYFANLGKDIVFLKPSLIPSTHTPDIIMDSVEWEIKCPKGGGKHTIETNFRSAIQQSYYLIFDLRRCRVPENQSINQLEKEFYSRSYLKKMYVIKKNGELLKYPN